MVLDPWGRGRALSIVPKKGWGTIGRGVNMGK